MNLPHSASSTRTLVVHTGGVGDFLLFCPTLKRLNEDGPVTAAGIRSRLLVAEVTGLLESSHDLDDIGFDSVFSTPSPRLERFMNPFQRVIVWMNDDGTIRKAIESCGVRDVLVFPGLPPEDWNRHASQYYASCLGYEDLPPLRLPIASGDSSHDVLIHPGSGGARKNWPVERFQKVSETLADKGRTVTWIAGPAEENLSYPPSASVLHTSSLVTLARELTSARAYIGNDSGVTHLAAACGCPSVAIFGPTDPAIWAPRGEHVQVIQRKPWPSEQCVLKALAEILH
ncbi:MAG: glycosyltransferase family 9 protein [Candidatus Hydrogenedentes bacterium]|nr:glycosyltransferase family 9 protein [Candidatus Hydrogenedentota bacterium]